MSPITGKDVDDFVTIDIEETPQQSFKPTLPLTQPQQPVAVEEKKEVPPTPTTPKTPIAIPKVSLPEMQITPPKVSVPEIKMTPPKVPRPEITASVRKTKAPTVNAAPKSSASSNISSDPADPVTDAFSNIFGLGKSSESKDEDSTVANKQNQIEKEKKQATLDAASIAKKKTEAEEMRREALAAAEEKRQVALAAAEARRKEAEEKRAQALAAVEAKRKEAEEKRNEAQKSKQVESLFSKVQSSGTVSLGFFGFGQKSESDISTEQEKQAGGPRGVPKLKNWRLNKDGSITGLIFGSRAFGTGESVTTSPIKGKPEDNSVVTTKSGSK